MKHLTTYTGRRVAMDGGAPSLRDIAICLGRICRFAGNGVAFYPVLLHSMVVADLLPEELWIYGLLHDAPECIISDIPRPFKGPGMKVLEDVFYERILTVERIALPDERAMLLVKSADEEALVGEAYTVGPDCMHCEFPERCRYAEELILRYQRRFPPEDCIRADGQAVLEFTRRVYEAREIAAGKSLTVH